MGIQERKQKTKSRIVEAAEQLFCAQGFSKTTMNEVARHADVGVGTLYNYYPSKTDLLIAIFTEKVEDIPFGQAFFSDSSVSAATRLKEMTTHLIRQFVRHDRSLLRESIALAIGIEGEAIAFARGTIHLDQQLMNMMKMLIETDIQSGRLPESFDAELAVQMIHANAMSLVLHYVMDEQLTVESIVDNMKRRIDFLLAR